MGILVSILAFVLIPAYSQEDIVTLEDDAFGDRQRPAAVFAHEEHNEKAEIEECNVCHHLYQHGEKVEDESSESMGCADCHNVKEGYPTMPLMKAYHDMCQGCHKEKGEGPITCGECHPRGEPVASHETAH
ncbi:MAG: cytochrome c3 family protein [Desulfobacterales bacterium]|nr:cytochrome c3 family protein [Desulfobacterales bacterium]